MEWREALDEARGNAAALDELRATVDSERGRLLSAIGQAIDETRDYAQAASLVRQLMFVDRYASEIDLAEEAMHASRASA
jgi:molecular chaperone HscB